MKKGMIFTQHAAQAVVAIFCLTGTVVAKDEVTHVNAVESQKLIADKKVTVVDVRTPQEFAAGHIAGATNINFNSPDFAKAIGGLSPRKPYLVHCASGGRSTSALKTFQKLEFPTIYHLDGGFKAWEKAGLPVEK